MTEPNAALLAYREGLARVTDAVLLAQSAASDGQPYGADELFAAMAMTHGGEWVARVCRETAIAARTQSNAQAAVVAACGRMYDAFEVEYVAAGGLIALLAELLAKQSGSDVPTVLRQCLDGLTAAAGGG